MSKKDQKMGKEKSLRLPAEWEEQGGVQLTWPHDKGDWREFIDEVEPVFIELAFQISNFTKVLIVCEEAARVERLLRERGAQMAKVLLFEYPTNDTWARDHGGITVLKGDKPLVLDFQFNGWGLKFAADCDNLITAALYRAGLIRSAEYKLSSMVLEGGSIESDGDGTILTTERCLLSTNRNPQMSRKKVEKKLSKLLGAKRVLWLRSGHLAGDDTDSHIDTLARFCSKDTIAYVACDDERDEHYESLSQMKNELSLMRQENGEPYHLVSLPMPDPKYAKEGYRLPATYANFLITNNAVLVPTYRDRNDEVALGILRRVFADRNVIGVDCSALILQHGSLHCVTMQYPRGVL